MNPRHLLMGLALAGAAALVAFGDNTPDDGIAEAVERAPAKPAAVPLPPSAAPVALQTPLQTGVKEPGAGREPVIGRLLPRASLIGDEDDALGGGGDLFGRRDWNPPPPPQPVQATLAQAPPPPSAPPLPFTYLGKAAVDGKWEVYLARGDKTYVVRDKDVLEGTYRVDAVAPPNLTFTYLPLNQVQQLNIGVLD